MGTAHGRIPTVVTHDGRRIRYPTVDLKRGDTVVVDHKSNKITSAIKLKKDAVVMLVGEAGNEFATRITNLFVIGKSMKNIPVTLPKAKGIVQNPIIEREERLQEALNNPTKLKLSRFHFFIS